MTGKERTKGVRRGLASTLCKPAGWLFCPSLTVRRGAAEACGSCSNHQGALAAR